MDMSVSSASRRAGEAGFFFLLQHLMLQQALPNRLVSRSDREAPSPPQVRRGFLASGCRWLGKDGCARGSAPPPLGKTAV